MSQHMNGLPTTHPLRQALASRSAIIFLPTLTMVALAACSSSGGGSGDSNNAVNQSTGDMMQPAQTTAGRGCSQLSRLPAGGIEAINNSNTPEADQSAERLAREAAGDFVASNAIYTRVLADLAALKSAFSTRADNSPSACYQENQLIVKLNAEAEARRQAGNYSSWDRFNNKLRMATDAPLTSDTRLLTFTGQYNMARAAEQYERLAGVDFAEPNGFAGDGDDVCLEIRASDYLYIFDTGGGDCPSGCINHQYEGFSVDASGNISDLGSYSNASSEAQPNWFASAENCRSFL